jgi:hypothetical protein
LEESPAPRPKSRFQQILDADPALRERCDTVRRELQEAAAKELKAVFDSEILTAEDFAITINARAPGQ